MDDQSAQIQRNITERLLLSALQAQERSDEAQRLAATMEYQAMHDALTDLPNRTLLADRAAQAMKAASRAGNRVALLIVDLDGFKAVNDRFGHHIGDDVLRQVGARLVAVLRDTDTVARLGGDEFAILLAVMANPAAAAQVARKVLNAFTAPFVVDGVHHAIEASIGVTVVPDYGTDLPTLLRRADAAMYEVKRAKSRPVPDDALFPPRAPSGDSDGEMRSVSEQLVLSELRVQERRDRLREHLDFARAIMYTHSEGVYVLDTEERLIFINPAAVRLLGWTTAEQLGEHRQDALPFRHADDLDTSVRLSMHEDRLAFAADDTNLVCLRKDGTTFPVVYTVAPIVADGTHLGVLVTFSDRTPMRAGEWAREEAV